MKVLGMDIENEGSGQKETRKEEMKKPSTDTSKKGLRNGWLGRTWFGRKICGRSRQTLGYLSPVLALLVKN